MRISKKDIERLEYVERALESKNNHLAKVVHNVLHELNPEFVYVIQESGSWDYKHTHHTEVFATWGDALHQFKALARTAKLDMNEWLSDPEDIAESEQIDEGAQTASFEIYEDEDYSRLHDSIQLTRKEVV